MKASRFLVRFTNRFGDAMCKVIEAFTREEALAALPYGSKFKAIEWLGHSR